MIKFSITIPAYKAKYLKEAIESCLSQIYQNFEVIIVDDASPENLKEIVDCFSDSRIRYYRNEKNCGAENVVDNWNICLTYCTGKYVICMGDDDKLLPNSLDDYNKLIMSHPGLNVYHAFTELIDNNGDFYELQNSLPDWESGLSFLYNRWKGRSMFIGDFCYSVDYLRKENGYHFLPMAMGSDDITAFKASIDKGIAHTQSICFQYRVSLITLSAPGHKEKVKMKAILQEKEWYIKFFESVETDVLTPLDLLYYNYLQKELVSHFQKKIKMCLVAILKSCALSFFYYFANNGILGLSKYDIIRCASSAVLRTV